MASTGLSLKLSVKLLLRKFIVEHETIVELAGAPLEYPRLRTWEHSQVVGQPQP